MTAAKRPRVGAIGLSSSQLDSIRPLCGMLRPADSLGDYCELYSWTETDILVACNFDSWEDEPSPLTIDPDVNILAFSEFYITWPDKYSTNNYANNHYASTSRNTERELSVADACPDVYEPLAVDLIKELARTQSLPTVIDTSRKRFTSLVSTTSNQPVALYIDLPPRAEGPDREPVRAFALLLPNVSNLAAWFRAFLAEIHERNPSRVPHAPPRLSNPSDWYTPEERDLADQISEVSTEITALTDNRDRLEEQLAIKTTEADAEIRSALWADGDELTASVKEILSGLGFVVRDMDTELDEGQPKREDLRLTLPDNSAWEAIVEVKGYSGGTKTSDARQIREHRDHYTEEKGQKPHLTLWLANAHRNYAPSDRPAPDGNVKVTAEVAGIVHAQVHDLLRQWLLVQAGSLDAAIVVKSLVDAEPGLWTPPKPPD